MTAHLLYISIEDKQREKKRDMHCLTITYDYNNRDGTKLLERWMYE